MIPLFKVDSSLFLKICERIDITDEGCWEWSAGRSKDGYGLVWWEGKMHLVHRILYEGLVGPIPDGLELDHLCRNHACANPDHLQPVTHQVNCARGEVGLSTGRRNRAKTHCPKGHEYIGENLYINPAGQRQCRTCMRERDRRRYHKSRQEIYL